MDVVWLLSLLLQLSLTDVNLSASKYTYPLGKNIEAMEIIEKQLYGVKGNVGYASGYPTLQYESFLIKGCRSSYIDIPIPSGSISADLTFMLFVYPQAPLEGTILHYKSATWSNLNSDIKIALNGSTLWVSFTGRNGTTDYGTIPFPGTIGSDQWIPISISRDQSNGKLAVIINSTLVFDNDNNYPDSVDTVLPGTLRIGGSHDVGSTYFNGRITCLNILDAKFNKPSEIPNIRDECMTVNWPTLPVC